MSEEEVVEAESEASLARGLASDAMEKALTAEMEASADDGGSGDMDAEEASDGD